MPIAPPNTTVSAMRTKVRRLTVSSGESQLTTDTIDQALNTFINQDFPYAIKLDQMRSVYTFYTKPNIDRYPLNVNFNQGIRSPIYFEGVQGFFFKDRKEFFAMWPRWPSLVNPFSGDGTTTVFEFTIGPIPFLSNEVTLGVMGTTEEQIMIADDGNGNLYVQTPNPVTYVPSYTTNVPGMKNTNTGNPGDEVRTFVGAVDYLTGEFDIDFSLANVIPAAGALANLWVSQYNVGRPYSLLFWNNEFTVRPVPDKTYKVEVETYLTPVQFIEATDSPILSQWWQYISYGAAIEILRERQDFEGVASLMEGFKRQEALVLERQSIEEINQRNATIFSSTTPQAGWNQGQGWYW